MPCFESNLMNMLFIMMAIIYYLACLAGGCLAAFPISFIYELELMSGHRTNLSD